MTTPIQPIPYTAKRAWYSGGSDYYAVTLPDGAVVAIDTAYDLATLLNYAHHKGVDEGRKLALKGLAPETALHIALDELNRDPSILGRAREMAHSASEPAIIVPWSDLTDGAKDSIRADYPYSKWTEAKLAATMWTKSPGMVGMRLWVPYMENLRDMMPDIKPVIYTIPTDSAPASSRYPYAKPTFPCWVWATTYRRWLHAEENSYFASHWSPDADSPPEEKPV